MPNPPAIPGDGPPRRPSGFGRFFSDWLAEAGGRRPPSLDEQYRERTRFRNDPIEPALPEHIAKKVGQLPDPWLALQQMASAPQSRLRLFCGLNAQGWEMAPPQEHVLLLGPPRRGKTTGMLIPAIIQAIGPVVSTSVREEVYLATGLARSRLGPLYHFAPDGSETLPGCIALRWSPIAASKTWDSASAMAARMAEVADVARGSTNGDYFKTTAQDLIGPVLHAAALLGEPIEFVRRALTKDDFTLDAVENALLQAGTPGARSALDDLRGIRRSDNRTKDPIFSTARTAFAAYRTDAARRSAEDVNFDPETFCASQQPPTLYITAQGDEQTTIAPIIVGLLSQIRSAWLKQSESDKRNGYSTRAPMFWALDELANISPLPDLAPTLSTGGGSNLLVMAALQDLSQARHRWPDHYEGMMSYFGNVGVFPGLRNAETLETLSRILGKHFVRKTTWSQNSGTDGGYGTSVSTSDELMDRLDAGDISAGRRGISDVSLDSRRILLLKPSGYDFVQTAPFYDAHPFTEALIACMEFAATNYTPSELRAGCLAPQLAAGDRPFLSMGAHLTDRYNQARAQVEELNRQHNRKALT